MKIGEVRFEKYYDPRYLGDVSTYDVAMHPKVLIYTAYLSEHKAPHPPYHVGHQQAFDRVKKFLRIVGYGNLSTLTILHICEDTDKYDEDNKKHRFNFINSNTGDGFKITLRSQSTTYSNIRLAKYIKEKLFR